MRTQVPERQNLKNNLKKTYCDDLKLLRKGERGERENNKTCTNY